MSDQNTHPIKSDFRPHHLELMQEDTQESATIYQLRASMNKKLSPQSSEESSSPEAAQERCNFDELVVKIDGTANPSTASATAKAIKGNAAEETKPERFKVRNLITNGGGEQGTNTTGTATTTTTTTTTTSEEKK